MAAVSSRALREQLSVIMAALTRAAVAEICEVVDEGYAVLQLEISRRDKENDALRKKLHLIQSIVVRGGGEAAAVVQSEVVASTAEPPRDETPPHQDTGGGGGATVAPPPEEEELPEVVLIKDEDSDSDNTYDQESRTCEDRATAAKTTPINCSVKRCRPGNDQMENSPLSSASSVSSKTSKQLHRSNMAVYSLELPSSESGSLAQHSGDEGELLCYNSTQMEPGLRVVQQHDYSLVSPSSSKSNFFSSSSLIESPSNRTNMDVEIPWTKPSKNPISYAQYHPCEIMDADAFGLKLISVSGSVSTDGPLSESSNPEFEYEDMDVLSFCPQGGQSNAAASPRKRFICSLCNKNYATAQNLDVHMRIHTGERPFTCGQCGKKFTQSAHLKSHLSIHSGERPHTCKLCSRSFIARYSLKLHIKKSHPDVQESHQ